MKISDKAGIVATFAAVPTLKKVYITENGDHYFNETHAKTAAGEEGKVSTLTPGSKELKDEAPAA